MYRDKDKLAINVAKLYYRSDYSQQKIAQELGVSRPSISRLLQYAKDKGYVNIQIVDPVEDMSHMEQRLKDKDKRRAAYHRFYTDMKWGHAQNYHLCLDSGVLGIDKCADLIAEMF